MRITIRDIKYLFQAKGLLLHSASKELLLDKLLFKGVKFSSKTVLNSCLGMCFPQNGKSLLRYILKTSGHACVHIVNLSATPRPDIPLPAPIYFNTFMMFLLQLLNIKCCVWEPCMNNESSFFPSTHRTNTLMPQSVRKYHPFLEEGTDFQL